MDTLMRHNPMFRQEVSKKINASNNQIRNKLQQKARGLLHDVRRTLASNNIKDTDIAKAIASLETYVGIREALLPEIALDGYTNDIKGMIRKLKRDFPENSGEVAFVVATKRGIGDSSLKLSKVLSPLHLLPEDAVNSCKELNDGYEMDGRPYSVYEVEVTQKAQFDTMEEYEAL
tara:strand:- start:35 stop:559 length:525 start_codon:yes stop_codon:yes gene_type:complete